MFITKKSINRRSMLKGLGAAISLPLLDSMMPRFAEALQTTPIRLGLVLSPQRHRHAQLDAARRRPAARRLPNILAPFASVT